MIFALADRILLKQTGCFLVEFSIDTAREWRALYLQRDKIAAYWRDKLCAFLEGGHTGFPRKVDTCATQISLWDSSLLLHLPFSCSTSLSHRFAFHVLGLVQVPNSHLHSCCTSMQTHLSRKKYSSCNMFPVESRVK